MSRTFRTSAFALSLFLSACSSGTTSQGTSSGGTNGTTSGTSTPSPVSTLASFIQEESCTAPPTSVAVSPDGQIFTVAGMLLQITPDGGSIEILPFHQGIVAVTASSANVFISEGKPIALYTEASYNQTYLAGGSSGCSNGIDGIDGGVGFSIGTALAADAQDNLYLADWSSTLSGCTRIRKVDSEGNTSTVAGSGAAGFMDGPASIAQFDEPSGIAVDISTHNLYVSDSFNNRIRMVDPTGMTTTIAGNGVAGFDDGSGTPNTPGSATFNLPTGIAVASSGNLYVADTNNNAIRMITPDGVTTTVAGNGIAGDFNGTLGQTGTTEFNFPIGVAVDSKGNIYVADQGNCSIRMITPSGAP